MLRIGKLKKLIELLPDEAGIIAYEGEGIGLRVVQGNRSGWIETGHRVDEEALDADHDLTAWQELTEQGIRKEE